MTNQFVEAVGLGGLLAWSMLLIGTVLYDTRAGAPRPAPHDATKQVSRGFIAIGAGVPWVAGPEPIKT